MVFDPNISVISIAMFVLAIAGLICVSTLYAGRLRKVRACRVECDSEEPATDVVLPSTSVIVYSPGDAEILAKTLPNLLKQDFTGPYEVIVVDDGAYSDTDMVVKRLKHSFSDLYLTFAPDGARVLSRKKLALTLGIKAAKGDIIVVTDATTVVPSDKWLQSMVAPFTDQSVDVVLGYNHHLMPDYSWKGRQVAVFDAASDDVAWLSAAIEGNPYRGSANNLAYRKEKFFQIKGFSKSLNLRNGDDDIFVSEITDGAGVRVILSEDTIGTFGYDYGVKKDMYLSRLHHAFTGKNLSKSSRNILTFGEVTMWLIMAFALAGGFFAGVTNLFGWTLALVIILAMFVIVTVMWGKTFPVLGYDKLSLAVPLLAMTRPLRNLVVSLRSGDKNLGNYTWQ